LSRELSESATAIAIKKMIGDAPMNGFFGFSAMGDLGASAAPPL